MSAPLPRDVRMLGLVSLLTDASSEMIYPLLPAFLTKTLRAGPAFLGLVEGMAEAAASLLKIASGWASDRSPRRKPFVVAGYGLASLVRPLVAFATAPWHVLAVRVIDRVGKGIRTAPRDALLASLTPPDQRGRAYGFHRAMDNAGAMIGPLLASAAMTVTDDLRTVFVLAFVPAALAMATLVFGVRDAPAPARPPVPEGTSPLSRPIRLYLLVLAVFTLGNSSDAFLLLRAQEAGVGLTALPLVWTLHHLVKAAVGTWGGALSDRVGRRAVILIGWAVYALAYAGFALATTAAHVVALFAFYGLFHALTEGPERALLADLARAEGRGTAFGFYHAVTGGMLLPASLLTGAIWQTAGAKAALATGAALAGLAALGLLLLVPPPDRFDRKQAVG